MVRLPQGPWFPWSREFRWDRFPWQGAKRHARQAVRDQRDLAALVEAAATTVGTVVGRAGFAFRSDAAGVSDGDGGREVSVLYEADGQDVVDRFEVFTDEDRHSCVDLWIRWVPDTGLLDLSLPGRLTTRHVARSLTVDRAALRSVLDVYARDLAEQLGIDE